jgi:hypothetical protein
VSVNAAESDDIRPLIMYLEDATYTDTTFQARGSSFVLWPVLWSNDSAPAENSVGVLRVERIMLERMLATCAFEPTSAPPRRAATPTA